MKLRLALAAFLAAPAIALAQPAAQPAPPRPHEPAMFAAEIARFAEKDKEAMPPRCGIVFTGSSSIARWQTLYQDMQGLPVIRRGFGGSHVADVNFYFDQVVAAYHPRAIFFYAGDNDLAYGKSPDQVAADFRQFMELKDKALGDTPVWFISVKPSKLRFDQLGLQAQVNDQVRRLAAERKDLHYVDVVADMLQDGKPKEIFVSDGLHMTPDGYAIWTRIIRPEVEKAAKAKCR